MRIKELNPPLKYDSKKDLYKYFALWSSSLLNAGVIFFSITINMVCKDQNNNMDIEDYDTKKAIAYISAFLNNLSDIDFVDGCFGSVEIGKKGIPKINCVVGFRVSKNLIPFIRQKIDYMMIITGRMNYKLKHLYKFKDVTKSLRYLAKNFYKERVLNIAFHCDYSEINTYIHELICSFIDTGDPFDSCISGNTRMAYYGSWQPKEGPQYVKLGRHSSFSGIPFFLQKNSISEIVHYLVRYLTFRNYILYKGSFYQKVENSLNSYRYIDSIKIVKVRFVHYMNDLKENLFDFIDPFALSIKFGASSDKILDCLSVAFNFSDKVLNLEIIEFKNGLYLSYSNTFVPKSNEIKTKALIKKYIFTRYYPYNYLQKSLAP
jgi:hypothetical protein